VNERLFGFQHAFDHPVTVWITAGAAGLLAITPLLILAVLRARAPDASASRELWLRYFSWLVLAPAMIVPILAGAFWTMLALLVLALLAYREYARMTGCFRERMVSLTVVLGIGLVFLAVFDHWLGLFVAAWPLTFVLICIVGLLRDQPKGYVQRTALGFLGFTMCGVGFGHLAYFANDAAYRPMLMLLLVGIQLNDVFAFCCGKLFGRTRLIPNTSPGKTQGGAIGAAVLTTSLVAFIGHFVFAGSVMDHWLTLLGLGLLVAVLGQLGDLMLSAIKRDVGIKDTGHLIPGHGGLLDRFDSTLLVAPAAFHYVHYHLGIGLDQTPRLLTG
jgi:phosphatidate cytidylyltransferase